MSHRSPPQPPVTAIPGATGLLMQGSAIMHNAIDWNNLGFSFVQADHFVRVDCTGESWGPVQSSLDFTLSVHAAATCLHYGQACFEGLKAFGRNDGSIAMFRPQQNALRLQDSARRLLMQPPPVDVFMEAVHLAVNLNRRWVPPYGTGASLYLRPLLIGTCPRVGVNPSDTYSLIVLAMPVGPYYKDGFFPVRAKIQTDYDRAAPLGVGNVKASGNYAAGMLADTQTKREGFAISLYLDAAQRRYIDEFGTSNFFAIDGDQNYVTPLSRSILPSITNNSLQTIARDFGLSVQKRPVEIDELSSFVEVGACGTAAIITPICSISCGEREYAFGKENEAGATLTRLYNEIRGIQYGEKKDRHAWMVAVDP